MATYQEKEKRRLQEEAKEKKKSEKRAERRAKEHAKLQKEIEKERKNTKDLALHQIVTLDCLGPWGPGTSGLDDSSLYRHCFAVIEENGMPVALTFNVWGSSVPRGSKPRTTTAITMPIKLVEKYITGNLVDIRIENGIPRRRYVVQATRIRNKVHEQYINYVTNNMLYLNPTVKDITLPVFELTHIIKNNWGIHLNGTMLMPRAQGRNFNALTYFDNAMYKYISRGILPEWAEVTGMKMSKCKDGVLIGKGYEGGTPDHKYMSLFSRSFEYPVCVFKAYENIYSNYELLMKSAEDVSKTPVPFLIHINWEHIMTKEKAVRYAQSRIEQEQKLGIPFGLTYEQALAEIETFDYITESDAVEIQKNVERFNDIMTARYQSGDYDKYYGYSKSKQSRKKLVDKIFKK